MDIDRQRWYYEVEPPPHADAPPLVLVHGASANLRIWDPVLDQLNAHFHVHRPDLLGHGLSAKPAEQAAYSVAAWAASLRVLFDHWCLDRAFLVGHSLGGMIALEFVLTWPERVCGLGLLDTTPGRLFREPAHLAQEELLCTFVRQAGIPDAFEQFQTLNPYAERWAQLPGGIARLKAQFCCNTVDSYLATRQALRDKPRHTPRLGEITVPTAVLVGEHDEPFLVAAEVLAAKIPRAKKYVIPDAGHSPQLDNPAAAAAALAEALLAVRNGGC